MKLRDDEALIIAPNGIKYRIVGFKATIGVSVHNNPYLQLVSNSMTDTHAIMLREIKRDENGNKIDNTNNERTVNDK